MQHINLNQIREQAQDAIQSERDWDRIMNAPITLETAMNRLKGWNQWYLKKNQLRNFIRIVQHVPKEFIDNHKFWKHYLQLFVKGQLEDNLNIDIDTYTFISNLEGWEREENGLSTNYLYKNKNTEQLQMFRYEVRYTSLALHLKRSHYSNQVVKTYEGPNEQCIPYRVRKKVDFKIISITPA